MEPTIKDKKSRKKVLLGSPKRKPNRAPDIIVVRSSRGGVVSMRRIPDEEIKALRNPAYEYLA